MFPVTHLLRLILLLLVPLWLSLGAEALGLRLPFASVLSGWMHTRPPVDPALVPPPGWREATYLDANPDIAAAVRSGGLVSGYAHYVRYGRAEGRPGGLPDDRPPETAPARLAEQPPQQPVERQALAQSQKSEQTPAGGASATRTAPIPAAPGASPQPALPQTATVQPAPEQAAPEQLAAPSPVTKPPPPASPPLAPLPAVKPAAPQAQEAPIQVSGLRTGAGSGSIRIVLDLDRAPRFETPASGRDGTLTVLLPGTVWKTSPTGRLPAAGWSYRAEPAGGASRLIILGAEGGPATVKAIFAMPPEGDRGHRLVIDLAPPPNKAKPARTAATEQKRT